jgi:hypothetical protein
MLLRVRRLRAVISLFGRPILIEVFFDASSISHLLYNISVYEIGANACMASLVDRGCASPRVE